MDCLRQRSLKSTRFLGLENLFAGPRGRAFSGADDYFDLWLFDLTKGDHDADDPF